MDKFHNHSKCFKRSDSNNSITRIKNQTNKEIIQM